MHIDVLAIETHGKFEIIHEPKLPQLEKAIAGLDGDAHTMVVAHAVPDAHMVVSSGKSGWCLVSLVIKQKEFYCLLNPSPLPDMPEQVKLTVIEVEGVYPKEMLVPKGMALKAAKPFAEKGQLDPSLQWRAEHLEA